MNAPTPKGPPEAFYWTTIAYRDGEFGEHVDRAKQGLAAEAREAGLSVVSWAQSPARVTSLTQEQHGVSKDLRPLFRDKRMCEVTLLAVTKPIGPERWVRITHTTGPTAAELLEIPPDTIRKMKGLGVKRTQLHPQDLRNVSMGYAQRALEESGQ